MMSLITIMRTGTNTITNKNRREMLSFLSATRFLTDNSFNTMAKRLNRPSALLLGAALVLSGCAGGGGALPAPQSRLTVSRQWNDVLLQAIRDVKPGPPIVARAIGVTNTAMYDAWAAYDARAVGAHWTGDMRQGAGDQTDANRMKAISFAAARILTDLFPTQKAKFDAKLLALGYDPADTSTTPTTAAGVGNACAASVAAFRHNDGSNQLGNLNPGAYSDYTGYSTPNTVDTVVDPNQWQPLRFSNGATPGFIAPHWGRVTPFAIPDPASMRPTISLPQYGSAEYLAQAQKVVDYAANLTEQEKVIAEYWADGPSSELPPGHWILFASVVSERGNYNLEQDVKLYFMVGNAVMDSGIACWDCKRHFNYVRPITAIRTAFAGQMIPSWTGQLVKGEEWMPYQATTFITPPFAEFTSGHSTFSAAGAEILRRFTGSDTFGYSVTVPAGWSKFEANIPSQPTTLYWSTFSQAADEAGLSRLYGGIHFEMANEYGKNMGRRVGGYVWDKAQRLFAGQSN